MNKDQELLNRIAELEAQLAAVQQELFCIDRETLADIFSDAASVHGQFEKTDNLLSYLQCCLREHEHKTTHPTQQGLDAQLLDYLQQSQSTIDLLISDPMKFRVGGLNNAVSTDLRAAIYAAIAAQAKKGEQA